MAASDSGAERTERATPQRRKKAADEGQTPRSSEVSVALGLVVLTLLTAWGAAPLSERLVGAFRRGLSLGSSGVPDFAHQAVRDIGSGLVATASVVGPPALGALVFGVAGTVAQIGFSVRFERLGLKWSRLDPSNWWSRLASIELPVTVLKALFKGLGVLTVAIFALRHEPRSLPALSGVGVHGLAARLGDIAQTLTTQVAIAMVAVALLDVVWSRYRFEERIKMSKQEVKEEFRQTEGRPEVRAEIRRRLGDRAKKALETRVRESSAVVTNPSHYAVAVYYRVGLSAPMVTAKGVDYRARRIREIAHRHGVPVIEDRPLARLLHAKVQEGDSVPEELYAAVAELLSVVYRMKGIRPGDER